MTGMAQDELDRVRGLGRRRSLVHAVKSTEEARIDTDPADDEVSDAYAALIAIARAHGPEEIKHLTRAYQAMAPRGGGRIIDLTALVG